jgi:deoxyribodipyrimidine photolyase-related protein
MCHLAEELGDQATLVRARTHREGLATFGRPVVVHEPGSHAAMALVAGPARDGCVASVLPTPAFLPAKDEFAAWADGRGRW